MEDKQDVQKDYTRFTTAGRKDWKLMLESKKADAVKAAKDAADKHKVSRGPVKMSGAGVHDKKIPRGTSERAAIKDQFKEEVAATGAGTVAPGEDGIVKKRLGMREDSAEVVGVAAVPGSEMAGEVVGAEGAEQTSSPKIDSIEKKRAKLEQQMLELEEEKQRVIKLSQLAAQKAALQEQLAAIKEEMAEVKSGKGETGGMPSAEENVAGVDHEATETPGEEAAEHAEGETEEDESDEGEEKAEKEESDEDDSEEKEPKEEKDDKEDK